MRTISTEEELSTYRSELHADLLSRNPGRDFEILFGNAKGNKMESIVIWLDGKGELND